MVGFKGYLDIVMTREAKTNDSTDPELEMSTDRWECHSRQRYYYIIDSMSRTNTHNVPPTVGVVKTNSFIGVRNEEIFCLSGWAPWQWQTGESVGRSELSDNSRERDQLWPALLTLQGTSCSTISTLRTSSILARYKKLDRILLFLHNISEFYQPPVCLLSISDLIMKILSNSFLEH